MFVVPALVVGAIVGWYRAGKLGGNRLDKLQYAAAHGLCFFIIALVLTVFADWQGWV